VEVAWHPWSWLGVKNETVPREAGHDHLAAFWPVEGMVNEQGRESVPAATGPDEQGSLHTWRVYGAKLLLASGLCHLR
jgi:hypothetical protein